MATALRPIGGLRLAGLRTVCLAALIPTVVAQWGCDREPGEPTRQACAFEVSYAPSGSPRSAAVVGEFNQWDATANPLIDGDGDGVYRAVVATTPGPVTYLIEVDGERILDERNPLTLFSPRGVEMSLADMERCAVPGVSVTRIESTADRVRVHFAFEPGPSGSGLDRHSVRARLSGGREVAISADDSGFDVFAEGLESGKVLLSVDAADLEGLPAPTRTTPIWVGQEVFDWRDAIIYQVMVDRFRRGGGELSDDGPTLYHGGDLAGVTEAIEEGFFRELGVNVIWLSPLADNPEGRFVGRDGFESEAYHGYWPTEPKAVEERFGGARALDDLMETAHRAGLRVVLDVVLNHVHEQHPYFREPGRTDWFNHVDDPCVCGVSCPWAGNMLSCWFNDFLPDLDWRREAVVHQMIDDTLWWVERFDLDGLRIDAVPMMPRLAVRQLRHGLRKRMGQAGDAIFLLGETYTGRGGQGTIRTYLGPDALSGQFDFPVMWALRAAVSGRAPMSDLDAEVLVSEAAWDGSGAVMAEFLGNHDVPRFVSDVAGQNVSNPHLFPPAAPRDDLPYAMMKLAWTFVMTQPGAPVIYYGDELAMAGGEDPDNRRNLIPFEDVGPRGRDMLATVRTLTAARSESMALRRGRRQTLMVHDNKYIYGRDAGDGRPAFVILNRATLPMKVEIEVPTTWALTEGAVFADIFGAPVESEGRRLHLTVAGMSSAVLVARAGTEEE